MSHAVVVVAAPQLLPAGVSLGAVAAGAGVAALACYGSYLAIRRLHQDYHHSLAEFRQRSCADEAARRFFVKEERAQAMAVAVMADQTRLHAVQDASVDFLHAQVTQLLQRIPQLPTPDPDLDARCAALLHALADDPDALPRHIEAYNLLAEQLAKALGATASAGLLKGVLAEELAALRGEIASPLLSGEECRAMRAQLGEQLASLEKLAKRQPKVARQGITLLQLRVHRELQAQAAHAEARWKAARDLRECVGEMLAKLHAVSRQPTLPEQGQLALALLARLGEVLTQDAGDDLATLRELAAEADALFAASEKLLEEQTMASYMTDQISDVLLAMGYKVAQVAPEGTGEKRSLLAAVGSDIGVEFHVNGKGQMGAHMVALSEDAAQAGQQHEARVCELIDHVMETLQSRQCAVRERFRSMLAPGEDLRVVELPPEAVQVIHTATAPKYMTVDQP